MSIYNREYEVFGRHSSHGTHGRFSHCLIVTIFDVPRLQHFISLSLLQTFFFLALLSVVFYKTIVSYNFLSSLSDTGCNSGSSYNEIFGFLHVEVNVVRSSACPGVVCKRHGALGSASPQGHAPIRHDLLSFIYVSTLRVGAALGVITIRLSRWLRLS